MLGIGVGQPHSRYEHTVTHIHLGICAHDSRSASVVDLATARWLRVLAREEQCIRRRARQQQRHVGIDSVQAFANGGATAL